jgi:predicted ferric reductase
VALATGAVLVLDLWWRTTPPLHTLADWLTNAGRITGLLAGYGIVALLGLMARVPALERGVGTDRLARWHSRGGRYVVGLVVAHALLITWGYAVQAHTGVVGEGKTLLVSYPDVLMATAAGLLLVAIGVISARAVRPRMRYETWFHLHFYTYLAAALAFSHQLATGAQLMSDLPARVLWSAMYVGVAVLLVWYRFVTPVRQSVRHRLHVVEVRRESPEVVSVLVGGRRLHELRAEPGQFFRWRFLTRDLWWSANPYSLSAPVARGLMRITVKDLGDHSRSLARLRPGTPVVAEGPYGSFTPRRRRGRKTLLVAGGVGITPVRALFEAIPGDVTLLYRTSRPEEVVLRRELEDLARRRGARLLLVVGSRRALGSDPLSAPALTAQVPGLRDHDVYVCGPSGMTSATVRALRAAGVPRRRIHHESFAL